MTRSILVYVQHLLGTGHLRRAALIARALAAAGFDVHLASGGTAIPDLDCGAATLHQLPPVAAADESFRVLVDEHGRPIDDARRDARRAQLLALYERCEPSALVFELFPFGRRQMTFEIRPLLDRARSHAPRPLIVSSVRDIIQARKPPILTEMTEAAEVFDHILVHGDPTLIAFGESFPTTPSIESKLHYTGYVLDAPQPRGQPGDPGWGEVIVSAGGGAVGARVLGTALRARNLSVLRDSAWRLLAGPNLDNVAFDSLRQAAPPGVIVERARSDFDRLIANCRLSVSQAGYNTIMEVIAARVPAVVVPYTGQGQTEQSLRAEVLARRGFVEVVDEADLDPQRLAAAVDRAAARPHRPPPDMRLDGASESARLIQAWLGPDRSGRGSRKP